ncbi:hypothetical protein VCB98_06150 [Gammaproteobacteria bacterium AB-CW1]|uniref:Uncharacterized protein n=1 Tax=Natronospira elongata TaxID=3110268 RepID=A0AAP6JE97_9GAMM|nr:hypothetical protein [Gammaproteobacteria bacterium AB-CW1]
MSEEMIIKLIVGGAVLLLAIALLPKLLARLKGRLQIKLDRSAVACGETLSGHCEVKARREIDGRALNVALVGEEIEEVRRHGSNGRSRRRRYRNEIYRDQVPVSGALHLSPGDVERFDFELPVPESVPGHGGKAPEGALAQGLMLGAQLLGGRRRYYRWRVEARLEASGLDLRARQKISLR